MQSWVLVYWQQRQAQFNSEFAEAGSEHGFGLNDRHLETNLINIAILVGVLFCFWA